VRATPSAKAVPVSKAVPAQKPAPVAVSNAIISSKKATIAATSVRSYQSAFAKIFKVRASAKGTVIPLEKQHSEGSYAFRRGTATIPADGFYMLLWEVGLTRVPGKVDLRLGLNESGSMLSEAIGPGYDSGQQVSWLSRGDKINLQLVGDGEHEIQGNTAQLTVLRMG